MAGLRVPTGEVEISAVRAQGPGGQNVNKVSNAVQLRFDIRASSLPADVKARLLALADSRISAEGVVVIKAQTHRSLDRNRADACARLHALIDRVATPQAPRIPTQPTRASQRRRLDEKARRGQIKAARRRPAD